MRTFEVVEAISASAEAGVSKRFFGIVPMAPIGSHVPYPRQRITQPRYEAERLAIAASEPIRASCFDEQYFAMVDSERAQQQAHQLLRDL